MFGAGPAGHVCTGCGAEDKLYTRGYCARCTLARRTDELLSDPSGIVPNTLAAVRDAVVATRTPRTALNWLRKEQGAAILAALARGDIALTHEALDAHPTRRAADYLRAVLVASTTSCRRATNRWPGSSEPSRTCSRVSPLERTGARLPPTRPGGSCTVPVDAPAPAHFDPRHRTRDPAPASRDRVAGVVARQRHRAQ